MRKHLIALLVITPLLLSSQISISHAAAKAGAKCSKVGAKSVVGAKTFTCIKSGKKLAWDQGVKVAQPIKNDLSQRWKKQVPKLQNSLMFGPLILQRVSQRLRLLIGLGQRFHLK